jgi:hypothetical protein
MKRIIVLGLGFCASAAFATNQIEETVTYDGIEWTIRYLEAGGHYAWPYFPFEDYLKDNGLAFRSVVNSAYKKQSHVFTNRCGVIIEPQIGFCTACSRGYVAKWKIEENKLFLVEIGDMMQKFQIPNSPPALESYPLTIFDPNWKSPVFADWVTRKVVLAAREVRNGVEWDGYAKTLSIQIEHGVIKDIKGENPLFSLSAFRSHQADRERMIKELNPSATAYRPLLSDIEIKRCYKKMASLKRGMTPDEVEAILGKPDETSTWEPQPMTKDDVWFKDKNIKDIPAFVEAQKRNMINVCTYTTRYYFYKERKGKWNVTKDICVTLHFRFDNYPDKSKRSLKEVW